MRQTNPFAVRDMLSRSAKFFPDNDAVVDETTRYTYSELYEKVQQCAAIYHKLGVRKGDRVLMMMFPSTIHVVALFAAFELGALPVGLHIRETPKGLSKITEKVSPRILVYDAALEPQAKELLDLCPLVTGTVRATSSVPVGDTADTGHAAEIPADLKDYTMDFEPMPVYDHDTAAICLSSGTTGVPKGIMHTNRTFLETARGVIYNVNGIKSNDAYLNVITTSFVAWYNSALPFFNAGAKQVFRYKWDSVDYVKTLVEEKITISILVPTMWRMIFAQVPDIEKYDLSNLRVTMFAGEVMDQTTLQTIKDKVCDQTYNVYGTTEAGYSGAIMFPDEMTDDRLTSVGRASVNCNIRIIKQDGTRFDELPVGESGEILTIGPSIASQVWDNPELSRKIFEPEGDYVWWHSGDRGYLDKDGFLYIEGRTDDMIISGGINIMPARVEDELLAHADIVQAAVVGVPDKEWGQKVKAFVKSSNPDLTEKDLDTFLRDSELADFQRPRLYEFVEQLPVTATMKIDRKALRGER